MKILGVEPGTVLPEGVVQINLEGLQDPTSAIVKVGGIAAHLLGGSPERLTVRVPPAESGRIEVEEGGQKAEGKINLGTILAEDLHPVANPAVDSEGRIYVTYSGARGEEVTFGVFVVESDGEVRPFLAEIVNPTGLTVGPDECLYISSRHSGEVFRFTKDKRLENYAEGLGLATGLAFDSQGNLFVGDRSGTIYKIDQGRNSETFCQLEPSVAAYHLAVDGEDALYVTGPTLATQDLIYRIRPDGQKSVFFKGFGRPQGIGFDPRGRLQVAASYRGRKGLFSVVEGQATLDVSGPMLVGFAYSPDGSRLYCVDSASLTVLQVENGRRDP